MNEIWLNGLSPFELGLIVFINQLFFIFARTLNVIYTAEKKIPGSIITGTVVHLTWLLSIAIGVKSVMYLDWLVIFFSLTGGLSGTWLGIKLKKWMR